MFSGHKKEREKQKEKDGHKDMFLVHDKGPNRQSKLKIEFLKDSGIYTIKNQQST